MKQYLSIGIGLMLVALYIYSNQTAEALSTTSAIHTGNNPVRSFGGVVPSTGSVTLLTTSSDADFVIKDLILTKNGSSTGDCGGTVSLTIGSGDTIGVFLISSSIDGNSGWGASTISHRFESGMSIPANDTLILTGSYSCGTIAYTVAGIDSHP